MAQRNPASASFLADLSYSLMNDEVRMLLDRTVDNTRLNYTSTTILESMVENETKQNGEQLFLAFLDILKNRKSSLDFDTVSELIETCSNVLESVQRNRKDKFSDDFLWLQMERNTWRLIHSLYRDRFVFQKEAMDCDDLELGGSEKSIVEYLYLNNAILREYQLVVDWLEQCASEETSTQIGHFTDRTIAWENTLHLFQNTKTNVFNKNRNLVQSIDPDAPVREKRTLHDLDNEDQSRLLRSVFQKIRQGKIEEAQSLCEHFGQPWQAAVLEGWRLNHDPNYADMNPSNEKMAMEGNPHRDIWKKCAWMEADARKLDEYSRAIAAVFCGHLEALMSVCSSSWMDLMWAYLKTQIDIRVELEIRQCAIKNYYAMPDTYWNNKMSMEQIFDELAASKSEIVRLEAKNKINLIIRQLVLDDIPSLMRLLDEWLENEILKPQMLRFLTHVVLFLRQLDRIQDDDSGDKVIRAYVEYLIESKDPQLVAFYTAALPKQMQIVLFSQFLDKIQETEERRNCLREALEVGLDIDRITQNTVQMVRDRDCVIQREIPRGQKGDISELDKNKISVLEYLTFYPKHRAELLYQANALVRQFLASDKLESVRQALQMIPQDSVKVMSEMLGTIPEMPYRDECSIKEHICHNSYLAAVDGFNQWTHLYHNQPKQPQFDKATSNFTEKMAFELKEQEYKIHLEQWKAELEETKATSTGRLYNVILFPDQGWLVDPECEGKEFDLESDDWQHRLVQLNLLRKLCIPEMVLLLHKILHLSGDYQECVQIADEIANENRKLYECYSTHKMTELLGIIAESSQALLSKKCDPWGYSNI